MHDLEIREDGSAAAFMGRTPGWHGLGVVVEDQDLGIEEALLLARMRYEFSLTPSYVVVDGKPIEMTGGKQAVLRRNIDDDTDIRAFGGALSDRYKVHTLLDQWRFIEDILGEGASVETLGNLRDGASSFVTVKLPTTALMDTDNDGTALYMNVSTAHDGSAATKVSVSAVRVVCANTLGWAESSARRSGRQVSVRHNIELADASTIKAQEVLRLAADRADEVSALYSTLKAISMDQAQMQAVINEAFYIPENLLRMSYDDMTTGEKRTFSLATKARQEVEATTLMSPYRATGMDAWALYQGFVEYADYYAPVKGKDLAARRAERVLEGKADALKVKALDLILAGAGV